MTVQSLPHILGAMSITTDSRLQILKYHYIEGTHVPRSVSDFLGVCGVLDRLHKEKKVLNIYNSGMVCSYVVYQCAILMFTACMQIQYCDLIML